MILLALLTIGGTLLALIYMSAKIYGDVKIGRFGWAALGGFALVGIAAQFLPGMLMFFAIIARS